MNHWCMLNMNQPQKHYAKGKKPLVKGHILYDTMYKKCPEQANPLGTASRSGVARGWGEEGMGNRPIKGYDVCFWGDENVLELDSDDDCKTLWIF